MRLTEKDWCNDTDGHIDVGKAAKAANRYGRCRSRLTDVNKILPYWVEIVIVPRS